MDMKPEPDCIFGFAYSMRTITDVWAFGGHTRASPELLVPVGVVWIMILQGYCEIFTMSSQGKP